MTYLEVLLLLLLSLGASAHVGYLPISRLRRGGWILNLENLNANKIVPEAYGVLFKSGVSVVVMEKKWILYWSMLWKFYIITCSHVYRIFYRLSLDWPTTNYSISVHSVQLSMLCNRYSIND